MLNSEKDGSTIKESEMPREKRKRIYNRATGTFYRIRQRSSDKGKRGTIMGKWRPPTETKKKRRKR
jgi:hypothetical protein